MPTNVPRPKDSKSRFRRRRVFVAVPALIVSAVACVASVGAGAAQLRPPAQSHDRAFRPLADTSAPGMPRQLRLVTATATSLTVSWRSSRDNIAVAGYEVVRRRSPTTRTTGTTHTVGSLTCNTTYRVGIAAYDAAGNQSRAAWITASTAACGPSPPPPPPPPTDTEPPSAPSNVRVTSATTTSIGLTWTASTDNVGVAGYDVYLGDIKSWMTTTTSFTYLGLACGTSYVLGLEAYDARGNTSSRASVTASTASCPRPGWVRGRPVPGQLLQQPEPGRARNADALRERAAKSALGPRSSDGPYRRQLFGHLHGLFQLPSRHLHVLVPARRRDPRVRGRCPRRQQVGEPPRVPVSEHRDVHADDDGWCPRDQGRVPRALRCGGHRGLLDAGLASASAPATPAAAAASSASAASTSPAPAPATPAAAAG